MLTICKWFCMSPLSRIECFTAFVSQANSHYLWQSDGEDAERRAGRTETPTPRQMNTKGAINISPQQQRRRRGRRIKTFWRPRESEIRGEAEWQKCCIPSITQRLNSLHVLHVRSGCRSMVNNENSSLVCLFVLWLVAGWANQYASQSKLQGLLFFMNYLEFQTCRGGQIRSDPGRKKERERKEMQVIFFTITTWLLLCLFNSILLAI